ncbi:hypothetical protein [Zavarzinella formosa]|uniref:hypothetical protein n=1 Tax=Zavarzinella formosa TaxID=360055 RepID=UPI00035F43EC|nr:hypothetical protein [Zavarzinella formosa]
MELLLKVVENKIREPAGFGDPSRIISHSADSQEIFRARAGSPIITLPGLIFDDDGLRHADCIVQPGYSVF